MRGVALGQDPRSSVIRPTVNAVLHEAEHEQAEEDQQHGGNRRDVASQSIPQEDNTQCAVKDEFQPVIGAGPGHPDEGIKCPIG